MSKKMEIAIVGDFDPAITAHAWIPRALELAGKTEGVVVSGEWVGTDRLKDLDFDRRDDFLGIWCVPGSPYRDRAAVLDLIRFAREEGVPYLGTCGGYQHAILEFARNALGISDADLEEENPDAAVPLISVLPCRLTHDRRPVRVLPDTGLHRILGQSEITEEYQCGFGMNPKYTHLFERTAMRFVANNGDGIPQALEILEHPFFIGTAFQPERRAKADEDHPIVRAFVRAAASRSIS